MSYKPTGEGRRRARIELVPSGEAWTVRTLDPGNGSALAPERALRRLGSAPWGWPQPPEAEVPELDPSAPHYSLCIASDETPLLDRLGRLLGRSYNAGSGEIEAFGRYLFAVLLGDATWRAIRPQAGQRLDLELVLPAGDPGVGRLPWEMLHDGHGFIAMSPSISLVRRVPSSATLLPKATSPLSLLVVVGTGLADDAIRPAAEFLALVQNLRSFGLDRRLRPHLLLEATPAQLQAAIAEHRPTVVHVIAHGRVAREGACVELRDGQRAGAKLAVAAGALAGLLRDPAEALPAAVVLSVCHTADASGLGRFGEPATPFAAELVQQGVPLVVGMSGRVSDLACRLFTRAFYAALLGQGDLVLAAAVGRRAASEHGGYEPAESIDWALPALFAAEDVTPYLTIAPAPLERERMVLADQLAPDGYPPFCDRLGVLSQGDLLLASTDIQKRLGGELQVLVVRAASEETQIGRTWALQALAARAAVAGHLPLLVSRDVLDPQGDLPSDWHRFIDLLELAVELAFNRLGLPPPPCAWSRWLLNGRVGPSPGSVPELQQLANGPVQPLLLGRALRCDLLNILAAVRAHPGPEPRQGVRLLLLIDDVHRMADLAEQLLDSALGPFGLRQCHEDVRIAFVTAASGQPYQAAIQGIDKWLSRTRWARPEPLQRFNGLEERLAYQHFLLSYRRQNLPRPLVLAREGSINPEHVEVFFQKMQKYVEGLPTQLTLKTAEDLIDLFLELKVLVEARDEDVIALWRQEAPW